jgi:hypothetical protein
MPRQRSITAAPTQSSSSSAAPQRRTSQVCSLDDVVGDNDDGATETDYFVRGNSIVIELSDSDDDDDDAPLASFICVGDDSDSGDVPL